MGALVFLLKSKSLVGEKSMEKLLINGGNKLFGELEIGSAKNSYLALLAASILVDGKVSLHRYPNYTDTENMCEILKHIGAKIEKEDRTIVIDSSSLKTFSIPNKLTSLVRSSIFTLGAIIGRFKEAKIAYPGGCEIGARPIDIHIAGLRKLGVVVEEKHGYIYCDGRNMHSDNIILDFPSVGATENLIMASVLTKGETTIYNAAKEPEIVDLQNFLNKLGAKVSGAGTECIKINGVQKLFSGEFTPISDRIIAGTYMIAACICGGDVTLKHVNPLHMQSFISKLNNSACKIETGYDKIRVTSNGQPISLKKVETAVYPGIPTDLQAQIMALECISNGSCMIVENLFESRFKHVPELLKMGADIFLKDRVAIVRGVKNLFGAEVYGMDLRGTSALILAGLKANGYTKVNNVFHVDRGYENIEDNLASLGADIKRIDE